jgi:hypothetical protein
MKIYSKIYEPTLGQMIQIETEIDVRFRSMVENVADFPILDVEANDAIFVSNTKHLYVYLDGVWVDQGICDVADLLQIALMQKLS